MIHLQRIGTAPRGRGAHAALTCGALGRLPDQVKAGRPEIAAEHGRFSPDNNS